MGGVTLKKRRVRSQLCWYRNRLPNWHFGCFSYLITSQYSAPSLRRRQRHPYWRTDRQRPHRAGSLPKKKNHSFDDIQREARGQCGYVVMPKKKSKAAAVTACCDDQPRFLKARILKEKEQGDDSAFVATAASPEVQQTGRERAPETSVRAHAGRCQHRCVFADVRRSNMLRIGVIPRAFPGPYSRSILADSYRSRTYASLDNFIPAQSQSL